MLSKLKILFLLIMLLISTAWAELNLLLTEEQGRSVFERNSTYRIYLKIAPTETHIIGAIGELYIEYDKTIFEEVTAFQRDYHQLPSSIWESEKINFDHTYASGLNKRCIEYSKTDNNGPFWTVSTTANIYAIDLKVRTNAVTGNTTINFIYSPDNSKTKMIDKNGKVISLKTHDLTAFIDLDRTAPITEINYAGGIYNYAPPLRLRTNEDAIIHYTVVGGSNLPQQQTVSKNNWSGIIPLPAEAESVCYSTIYYYSEDFALDKEHNIEEERAYVFTVDMQQPVISNVRVPTQGIPAGTIAEVHFDAFDSVGIGSLEVLIGGKPAYLYSGSGNDTYIYRRNIDGTENPDGILKITLTDRAGNTTVNQEAHILLDFGGPEFYNISSAPDPAQINQEIIISFNASELLRENPVVLAGGNPASYIAFNESNMSYLYRYKVTANGWYVDLSFIPDNTPPFTERNLPQKFATEVCYNTSVYFRISDTKSDVNTRNMSVYINDVLSYRNGYFLNCNTEKSRIIYRDGLPNFIYVPSQEFMPGSRVTVKISVADMDGNVLNEEYYFDTGSARDTRPPEIAKIFPTENSEKIACETPLYFEAYDNNGCGIAIDKLNLVIAEVVSTAAPEILNNLYITKLITVSDINELFSSSAQGENINLKTSALNISGQINKESVIDASIFQKNYTGSIVPNLVGDMVVSILPEEHFNKGSLVACQVTVEDLAVVPNQVTYNWLFNIISAETPPEVLSRKPLAWPTIYNPVNNDNKNQLLTFSIKEAGEIKIRMYDLSGDMIWEHKYLAEAGYQAIPWNGKNSRGEIVGNGVYIWYILENNKVIGRGKSIIMK